jgi:pimeloyl-ACP methyl ester carboxylesterase
MNRHTHVRLMLVGFFGAVFLSACATAPNPSDGQARCGPTEASSEPRRNTAGAESSATATAASGSAEAGANDSVASKFDARLSGYDYPYPVEIREFEAQGQPLEMAYMDVQPESPNGQTVLLLHGKNFSGAYWGRSIGTLVSQGFRVIAPDQIGFGKSSKPKRFQFTFHALATHTRELLDALGVAEVTVVGHSMGGMLATRFALMFPDVATKLALVNPIGLEDWETFVGYVPIDTWYERELKKSPDSVREYMKVAYFDGTWKDEYDVLAELQMGWAESPDKERIAWVSALTYDMIYTQPVVYDFPRVGQPTLLIIGDRDRTALGRGSAPPEVAAKMGRYDELGKTARDAIPNAKLVELKGVGHIPQYEAYEAYMKSLLDFLYD